MVPAPYTVEEIKSLVDHLKASAVRTFELPGVLSVVFDRVQPEAPKADKPATGFGPYENLFGHEAP